MAATLAQELQPAAVDFDQLHRDYKPMLNVVREIIGVIPNCDPYLEIWPTGFKTYNLLVPNLLYLPMSLLGKGPPKEITGLAMYIASRTAGCMYCSAHTCSFALRRGASKALMTGEYTEVEAAVASVAKAMASVPADLKLHQLEELERHMSRHDVEWLVLAVSLMGFLNKFMDSM
mgnify:CR=1 FL=1